MAERERRLASTLQRAAEAEFKLDQSERIAKEAEEKLEKLSEKHEKLEKLWDKMNTLFRGGRQAPAATKDASRRENKESQGQDSAQPTPGGEPLLLGPKEKVFCDTLVFEWLRNF